MLRSKAFLFALVVLSLLTMTNCRWGQYRFDATHSGQNALDGTTAASAAAMSSGGNYDTTIADPINSSAAVDVWVDLRGRLPQVYNSMYITDHTYGIAAFDVSAHSGRWAFLTGGGTYSSPAVDGGVVYVGDTSTLYALDEVAGTLLWQGAVAQSDYGDSPTVANGVVYVGSTDAHVYGFAVGGCGSKVCPPIYTSQTFGYRFGPPPLSSPAVANGMIYSALMGGLGGVGAFDASTGQLLWGTGPLPDDRGFDRTHSPAVFNGVVYAGSDFGGYSGHLYAWDGLSGTLLWPYNSRPNLGPILSSPAINSENSQTFIYVGSANGLYKIDSNGAIVWGPKGGSIGNSSPAVANYGTNAVIFTTSEDGSLYAFDTTGKMLNKLTVGPGVAIESSPGVANQVVYVGASDGKVYAFR
jgi:outer membrane protein assembly factor BamB